MQPAEARIPGGYVIYPRVFIEMLAETPLLDRAMWTWLLCRASHKDTSGYEKNLRRGQLLTSLRQMQDAMKHHKGYVINKPDKDTVRRALRRLCEARMIATQKTTRGLLITIVQYGRYQNPSAYERDNEDLASAATRAAKPPHYKQEVKEEKNEKNVRREQEGPPPSDSFRSFYQMDCDHARGQLDRAAKEFLSDE